MRVLFAILITAFLTISSAWVPVKKSEVFRPIIYIEPCGENYLVGLDTNRNQIIDTCYELEWRDNILYKRHTKMWFDIYDNTVVKGQGCVCKN